VAGVAGGSAFKQPVFINRGLDGASQAACRPRQVKRDSLCGTGTRSNSARDRGGRQSSLATRAAPPPIVITIAGSTILSARCDLRRVSPAQRRLRA